MLRLTTLLIAILIVAMPATAQQTVDGRNVLTLNDALRIARENHPVFDVQQATLDAADAEERGTAWWLRTLPTVSFALGANVTQSRVASGTDEFGRPVPLDDPISYRRTDSDFGPTIGQITLFDGGAGSRSAASTRAGVGATRARVDAERIQFESHLTRAYYGAVGAERQIALDERNVEAARRNFEAAQRLLRIGAQDPLAVLEAEVGVAEAEQRLEQARGEVRKTRHSLNNAMGLPQDSEFDLADELPEVFDPAMLDANVLVEAALTGSPALAQVEASTEQSRIALRGAQINRWPTVSAYLQTRRGTLQGSGSDHLFYLNPLNQTYILGLSVRINVFDQLQTSNRIAQARANYTRALSDEQVRRLQSESEIHGALIDLENVYRTLGLQERTADLARQRLEMSEEKYRLGSMSFTELQNSLDAAYRADYDALTARFQFVSTLLALEEVVGGRFR